MSPPSKQRPPWTAEENAVIVAAYFEMLADEMAGRPYVKAAVRRRLQEGVLSNRTKGSIEYKFCNISSILDEHSEFYIDGYMPYSNVQRDLRTAVEQRLRADGLID